MSKERQLLLLAVHQASSDMNSDQTANSAVNDDYFRHFLNRTMMLLGEEAVQTLRKKTVAVAGCGGQGGAASLTLARMGVEGFVLADPKPFDEPDINRQWAAARSTLGRNKAEVYSEMLQDINPGVRLRVFQMGITEENVEDFLEGVDLLVDCLDISVSGALRKQLFASATAKGMHIFTGAMLGFGGMVAGSYPGGVSLEVLAGVEDNAIGGSSLPHVIWDIFVPDHLDRLEQSLPIRRAPSVAISPGLLAMILSVESMLALLGNTIPGWRPPLCLPHLLFVDLLRMRFQVIHIDDLKLQRPPAKEENSGVSIETTMHPSVNAPDRRRGSVLRAFGYNTNLLPHAAVDLDLLTDSWSEIPAGKGATMESDDSNGSPEQVLQGYYGYPYVAPVFRGRFAESILCRALSGKGEVALTNALFPTTRFHLESNGFEVREMGRADACDPRSDFPFKGELDLTRLQASIANDANIALIYVELCVNAIGGHPVSIAHLSKVRDIAALRGVPVILDACRAFENAVLIREREPGYGGHSLSNIVRELCGLSFAAAASTTKDFHCHRGGFIATHDEQFFRKINDLLLASGDGLDDLSREHLVRSLSGNPESDAGPLGRVHQVRLLWDELRQIGVPVVAPAGGHAVFVNAQAMLPHIPPDHFPAQTLANELFLEGGVRGTAECVSGHGGADSQLLRLAVPVGIFGADERKRLKVSFEVIAARCPQIVGLQRLGGVGAAGEYASEFRPLPPV